jgi:lipoprotein NlpD
MRRLPLLLAIAVFAAMALPAQAPTYSLAKGETLYSLARAKAVPLDVLARANGIADSSKVKAGEKLIIPGPYTVKAGDTLSGIALRHGMETEKLRQLNDLPKDHVLKIGQTIYVIDYTGGKAASPAASPSPAPKAASSPASRPSPSPAPSAALARATVSWPVSGDLYEMGDKLGGVEIRAPKASPIVAVSEGVVLNAGPHLGWDHVVFIQSSKGYIYVYGGNSEVHVRQGQKVSPGMRIATLGGGAEGMGRAFFMVFYKGSPVDPSKAPR